jgi:hypothetical protein
MPGWTAALRADPLDWLLEPREPAVRHQALRQLLDRRATVNLILGHSALPVANRGCHHRC